jgi:hypothetical protein
LSVLSGQLEFVLENAIFSIMMLLMRTTLNISDALLEELRERSRRTGRPLRQVTEDVLRRGLSGDEIPATKIQIQPFKLGIKPAYRGMSLNQLYDQLEAEDTVRQDTV